MSCSCKSKTKPPTAEDLTSAEARDTLPHGVLPGESCIFCAGKHLAIAYGMLTTTSSAKPMIFGELECARRHLLTEYKEEANKVADLMALLLSSDTSFNQRLEDVLNSVLKKAEESDPGEKQGETTALPATVYNPLVGLAHLCCAYRLAREIGYALPNKGMIIGSLALAGENLNRTIGSVTEDIRNIRHTIQTTRTSYMSEDWQELCTAVWNRVVSKETLYAHLEKFKAWVQPV